MKCLIALGLVLLIIALPLKASTDENSKVSFRHDVMPVLSKAGCNGGGTRERDSRADARDTGAQ